MIWIKIEIVFYQEFVHDAKFSHTTHCRFRAVVMLSTGPGPLLYLVTPRPRPHHVVSTMVTSHPGRASHQCLWDHRSGPGTLCSPAEMVPFEALDQRVMRIMKPWWWNNSPEHNSPEGSKMINYLLSSNRIVTEAIKLISFPKKNKLMFGMMLFLAKLMTNAAKIFAINDSQCSV